MERTHVLDFPQAATNIIFDACACNAHSYKASPRVLKQNGRERKRSFRTEIFLMKFQCTGRSVTIMTEKKISHSIVMKNYAIHLTQIYSHFPLTYLHYQRSFILLAILLQYDNAALKKTNCKKDA